jgi:hypothetical protein
MHEIRHLSLYGFPMHNPRDVSGGYSWLTPNGVFKHTPVICIDNSIN